MTRCLYRLPHVLILKLDFLFFLGRRKKLMVSRLRLLRRDSHQIAQCMRLVLKVGPVLLVRLVCYQGLGHRHFSLLFIGQQVSSR